MSLILEKSPAGKGKVRAKTFDAQKLILTGNDECLEINGEDFCCLVLYYLTNTDLEKNDPRLKLIEEIKSLEKIQGYNISGSSNKSNSSMRLGVKSTANG